MILWTAIKYYNNPNEWSSKKIETVYTIGYAVGVAISLVIFYKMAKSEIKAAYIGEEAGNKSLFFSLLICSLISAGLALGLNYLVYLLEFQVKTIDVDYVVGLIVFGIISPIIEEIMFRGMIYNRLKRVFTTIFSMCLSALLFGAIHLNLMGIDNGAVGGNIINAVYGFLMGLPIAFCYEKFKSFWIPVAMHIAANVSVYLIYT